MAGRNPCPAPGKAGGIPALNRGKLCFETEEVG